MTTNQADRFLRNVLWVDAATCIACGAFMAVAARPFGALTQLPPALLLYAGLSLFPIAAFIATVAARAAHSLAAVGAVVAGNLGWVLASAWLLVAQLVSPTLLGEFFIIAQALVVLALTACEGKGALRIASETARARARA
jgi:hypothetical protein